MSGSPPSLSSSKDQTATLSDVKETEIALWIDKQLERILEMLALNGADDEMLEAVEYLIDDNDRWLSPEITTRLISIPAE